MVFKNIWTRLPCYAHNAEMKEGETLEDFDYMLSMNDIISWTSLGLTVTQHSSWAVWVINNSDDHV